MNRASYSKLKTWLTCPRQYEAKYITREWPPFHDTPATLRGKKIHQALERAVRGEDEPDKHVWTPEGLLPALRRAGAEAEYKYERTIDGVTWVAYADVRLAGPHSTTLVDWKTGQFRPDELQADVYAMLERMLDGVPDARRNVSFSWVYVDQKLTHKVDVDGYARRRVYSIVDSIVADKTFDPKPCWACRFCPLTACEYNRSK